MAVGFTIVDESTAEVLVCVMRDVPDTDSLRFLVSLLDALEPGSFTLRQHNVSSNSFLISESGPDNAIQNPIHTVVCILHCVHDQCLYWVGRISHDNRNC